MPVKSSILVGLKLARASALFVSLISWVIDSGNLYGFSTLALLEIGYSVCYCVDRDRLLLFAWS